MNGTHFTPYQWRIYEIVRRAGQNGIESSELFNLLYEEDSDGGPLTGRKSMYAIVRALNRDALAHNGYTIRAFPNSRRAPWSYRLVKL